MSKPALFYAITRDPYAAYRDRLNGRDRMIVVEVTTLKTRQWWGRRDGEATNGRVDAIVSRFNKADDAATAARMYGEAWAMATPAVAAAELALNEARDAREQAAMQAIADLIRSNG